MLRAPFSEWDGQGEGRSLGLGHFAVQNAAHFGFVETQSEGDRGRLVQCLAVAKFEVRGKILLMVLDPKTYAKQLEVTQLNEKG